MDNAKKLNSDQLIAEIKENQKKLKGCSHHEFSIPVDRRTKTPILKPLIFCDWMCQHCKGVVDGQCKYWYEMGLKHSKTLKTETKPNRGSGD